jgi:hypothetical protein
MSKEQKMSDLQNTEDFNVEEEQLDEFKASMGDPSSVPEPVAKGSTKRKQDKAGAEAPVAQGSSSSEKAKEVEVPKTKMAMINAMVQQMNGMKKDVMAGNYQKMMAAMKNEEVDEVEIEDRIELSARDELKVSADDLDMSEDLGKLFDSNDLSEEFKEKATTIFEAAVVSKINEQLEKVTVDIEGEIAEAKEQIAEGLSEKLDSYLDYVVENWMDDNKLAVEKGLKAEIAHDFMEGLKGLFAEHYIDVPDDKVDVAEELATKSEELEDSLNEQIEKNAQLRKELEAFKKQDTFAEVAEDLSATQAEKFASLAEGIDFTSEEAYKKKLQMVKENYFPASITEDVSEVVSDDEEPLELDEEVNSVRPEMAAYMNAISRTKGSKNYK